MKGLVNIVNNDNNSFLWCNVRHLNRDGKNLGKITKKDKEIGKTLNYSGVDFPVSKKYYCKISVMNVFCYEDKVVFLVYLSDQFIYLIIL